jgi:AcrR family transcriptional regulator
MPRTQRTPLSRDRVLQAAVDLADRDGIDALTMRNLAADLGVEAMSLYHHVANKEAILDGVVEVVVAEINDATAQVPDPPGPDQWKDVLRARILVARQVLLAHPWAPGVIESRTALIPPVVLHFERVLGVMRQGGLSWDTAHHALHALGSRALGFTQELFAPADVEVDEATDRELLAQMAEQVPNLVAMLGEVSHADPDSTLGWCDDQAEFEFGLDLLLDGLDRLR